LIITPASARVERILLERNTMVDWTEFWMAQ
jgi:hypothetical protein